MGLRTCARPGGTCAASRSMAVRRQAAPSGLWACGLAPGRAAPAPPAGPWLCAARPPRRGFGLADLRPAGRRLCAVSSLTGLVWGLVLPGKRLFDRAIPREVSTGLGGVAGQQAGGVDSWRAALSNQWPAAASYACMRSPLTGLSVCLIGRGLARSRFDRADTHLDGCDRPAWAGRVMPGARTPPMSVMLGRRRAVAVRLLRSRVFD